MIFVCCALVLSCSVVFYTAKWLRNPSRKYFNATSVASAYDSWTADGILESYWGEHIHLGWYDEAFWFHATDSFFSCLIKAIFSSSSSLYVFKSAKDSFTLKMAEFGGIFSNKSPQKVLDIGCGIGGSARKLATVLKSCHVTGISISPEQVKRATELTSSYGMNNASFDCQDAISMGKFADDSFDVVWLCESSEHIQDKKRLFTEAHRVLKPGGNLVMAAWCCRDGRGRSISERSRLKFLEDEWSHPRFASVEEIERILTNDLKMDEVIVEDWTTQTLPSWRHSILVGIWWPWPVIRRPGLWMKTVREIFTISEMHSAFCEGLMRYGMFKATKPL